MSHLVAICLTVLVIGSGLLFAFALAKAASRPFPEEEDSYRYDPETGHWVLDDEEGR